MPVGAGPVDLAAGGGWIVAAAADGTLTRIDARGRLPVGAPVEVGGQPVAVAVSGDTAWVADAAAAPSRASTSRRAAPRRLVAVGGRPVAVAADGDDVYVLSRRDRTRSCTWTAATARCCRGARPSTSRRRWRSTRRTSGWPTAATTRCCALSAEVPACARRFLLALAMCSILGGLGGLHVAELQSDPEARPRFIPPREEARDFRLRDQDGHVTTLADARGDVVVLTLHLHDVLGPVPGAGRRR